MASGQLCSRTTQALFYNYKQLPTQRMLDFDFLCGRETPSVAGIINPGAEGFQKLFFGQEEIAIPVHASIEAACSAHPTADVFINFASFRSAAASSMSALEQPTIRVVAIIAEGVPEADTKSFSQTSRLSLVLPLLEESKLELLRSVTLPERLTISSNASFTGPDPLDLYQNRRMLGKKGCFSEREVKW